MTDPDDHYGVNLIPAFQWALDLYLKKHPKYRLPGIIEVILPAGHHKERMRKVGEHDIVVWISDTEVFLRTKCSFDNKCKFVSRRMRGRDREALKELPWGDTDVRKFFSVMRDWVLSLKLDFVTIIKALNTVCDRYVEIPMTTQYGKTFEKFDEYRRNRWPEDATPDNRPRFIEEVLLRVCFWIMTAAKVGALKPPPIR